MVRVEWDRGSALFSGDVETLAEQKLAQMDIRSTILKAPHHGSNTSSSLEFLTAVSPRYAVVTRGTGHSRGPMDAAVLRRYADCHITLFRTDHDGGVIVSLDEMPVAAIPTRDPLLRGLRVHARP